MDKYGFKVNSEQPRFQRIFSLWEESEKEGSFFKIALGTRVNSKDTKTTFLDVIFFFTIDFEQSFAC